MGHISTGNSGVSVEHRVQHFFKGLIEITDEKLQRRRGFDFGIFPCHNISQPLSRVGNLLAGLC